MPNTVCARRRINRSPCIMNWPAIATPCPDNTTMQVSSCRPINRYCHKQHRGANHCSVSRGLSYILHTQRAKPEHWPTVETLSCMHGGSSIVVHVPSIGQWSPNAPDYIAMQVNSCRPILLLFIERAEHCTAIRRLSYILHTQEHSRSIVRQWKHSRVCTAAHQPQSIHHKLTGDRLTTLII